MIQGNSTWKIQCIVLLRCRLIISDPPCSTLLPLSKAPGHNRPLLEKKKISNQSSPGSRDHEWMAELQCGEGLRKTSRRNYIPRSAHNSPSHNLPHNSGQWPACCNFRHSLLTVHIVACRRTRCSHQLRKHSSTSSPLLFDLRRYYLFVLVSNRRRSRSVGTTSFRFSFQFLHRSLGPVTYPTRDFCSGRQLGGCQRNSLVSSSISSR